MTPQKTERLLAKKNNLKILSYRWADGRILQNLLQVRKIHLRFSTINIRVNSSFDTTFHMWRDMKRSYYHGWWGGKFGWFKGKDCGPHGAKDYTGCAHALSLDLASRTLESYSNNKLKGWEFDHLKWTCDGAFEQLFGLGRAEFERSFFKTSMHEGYPERGCWSFHLTNI